MDDEYKVKGINYICERKIKTFHMFPVTQAFQRVAH